jgi:hypothetical protein
MTRREAALKYAALGWPVLPIHSPKPDGRCSCYSRDCRSVGKHPRVTHGLKDASTDPQCILKWWTRWPEANIGVLTGASSGLVVIDVDPRHGGDRSLAELERQYGPIPPTRSVTTGSNGRHLYFQHPGGTIRNSAGRLGEGVDVRGEDGYVVAPPSLHANGKQYRFEEELDIASLPDWLLRLMKDRSPVNVYSGSIEIVEGVRNSTLTSLAGTMRRRGSSVMEIEEALLEANAARCRPQLKPEEVRAIAASVGRYEPSQQPTGASVSQAFELPQSPGTSSDRGRGGKNGPVRSEGQEGNKAGGRLSKADRLILLVEASDTELFHNSEGRTFATVRVGSHFETFKLESSGFKQWCEHEFWRIHGSGIHASGFKEALGVLRAFASYRGARREVHMRVAGHMGNVYLDLGDPDWSQIEITRAQWRIVAGKDSPVRFRRAPGMLPLPVPIRGGKVEELRPFLNAPDDETWVLLLAWLVMCFNPRGPYPVLILNGEQGSAKSTTTRFLRDLIDPNSAGLRAAPREERDFYIAGNNSYVLTFDNMSGLSRVWSDAICRVVTGGALAVRTLYSDDDETVFNLMRPVVLNGIEDIATRGDMLSRALNVTLPPLPSASRRDEREIHNSFEAARPRILGALLDVVVAALRKYTAVELSELPRMADFARWITAAEEALGFEPGLFMRIYARNQEVATDIALESSIVALTLQAMMDRISTTEWRGTATKLLAELNEELISRGDDPRKTRGWPQSARALSNVLRRLAPHLRAAGISLATGERAGKNRDRLIIITKLRDNADVSLSASSALR